MKKTPIALMLAASVFATPIAFAETGSASSKVSAVPGKSKVNGGLSGTQYITEPVTTLVKGIGIDSDGGVTAFPYDSPDEVAENSIYLPTLPASADGLTKKQVESLDEYVNEINTLTLEQRAITTALGVDKEAEGITTSGAGKAKAKAADNLIRSVNTIAWHEVSSDYSDSSKDQAKEHEDDVNQAKESLDKQLGSADDSKAKSALIDAYIDVTVRISEAQFNLAEYYKAQKNDSDSLRDIASDNPLEFDGGCYIEVVKNGGAINGYSGKESDSLSDLATKDLKNKYKLDINLPE